MNGLHVPVVSLRVVRDRSVAYRAGPVTDSRSVFALFSGMINDLDREAVWVACMDQKGGITCVSQVALGTTTFAIVECREVLKIALVSNASSIVLVHNHPSGCAEPSEADNEVTEVVAVAAELLGLRLDDHLIIGAGDYYSYADAGLLGCNALAADG